MKREESASYNHKIYTQINLNTNQVTSQLLLPQFESRKSVPLVLALSLVARQTDL